MDSEGWITESYFSLIPEDGLLMTLSQADERMSEPALHNFFVMVCKLRDRADGDVVGVATELEERHPDPATEGMITRTEWSIFLPGKGTLHFDEIEDQSGVQRHVLNPAGRSGQTWTGRWEVITTVGPGLDGKGVIEGGTRAFHGAHGNRAGDQHDHSLGSDGWRDRRAHRVATAVPHDAGGGLVPATRSPDDLRQPCRSVVNDGPKR